MEPADLFRWVRRRRLSRNRVRDYYRIYRKIHQLTTEQFRRHYLAYQQAIFRSNPNNKVRLQEYFNRHSYRPTSKVKSWTRTEVQHCIRQMQNNQPASMIASDLRTTIHSIRYIGRKRRMCLVLLKIASGEDYIKKEKILIDMVYSNTEDELRERLGNTR